MANGGRSYQELLFDSTLIIALVTSILYLVGHVYYRSFFSALLIPYRSIDLSVAQCITITIEPFSALIAAFLAHSVFELTEFKDKFKIYRVRLFLFILIVITIIILIKWQIPEDIFMSTSKTVLEIKIIVAILLSFLATAYMAPKSLSAFAFIATLVIFQIPCDSPASPVFCILLFVKLIISIALILFLYINIKQKTNERVPIIGEIDDVQKIFKLIIIIIIICFTSILLGSIDASNMIDGSSPDALQINISLKDENNTAFENKTLILVMLHKDNYYIIERNENYPAKPKLYIISTDQIEMAVVDKKGEGMWIYRFNKIIRITKMIGNQKRDKRDNFYVEELGEKAQNRS